MSESLRRIALVGDHLPRRCGIATFTTHLCDAIAHEFPALGCSVLAVNDRVEGYDYPSRVRFDFPEDDRDAYREAAEFLDLVGARAVSLQHEFGIFGGRSGSHILEFLRRAPVPVVSTLHTVLEEGEPDLMAVLREIVDLSERVVVMSLRGQEILEQVHRVPAGKIERIPHGIPDMPFADPAYFKDELGVAGRFVLLTFGLLGANKGIEYVVRALPDIVRRHPRVIYLVLGATHPHVKAVEGERYRESLAQLATSLGVREHLVFEDRFVSEGELLRYLGAADVYVTPYLHREQITSGTLAYALGAGKAVVSTPYWYAEEQLADGRGLLVPFADAGAIADAVVHLLGDEEARHAMRKRAYLHTREMTWPAVARRYVEVLARTLRERSRMVEAGSATPSPETREETVPPLELGHLRRLTDDTGILQHAVFTVPNRAEGYTTDDNARALVLAVLLGEERPDRDAGFARDPAGHPAHLEPTDLADRYLAFLWEALGSRSGRMRNFMSYDRRWLEEMGSEDSHGRALWALGVTVGRGRRRGLRDAAARLLDRALPAIEPTTSPRAWAFAVLGLGEYLRRFPGDRGARELRRALADRLLELYSRNRDADWRWFEEVLSYANARLPHALLSAGASAGRRELVDAGLESLGWLAEMQRGERGQFVPVGSRGFWRRGGPRARFDQQPVEASAMVSACLEAYRLTGEPGWREEAWRAFRWFTGTNDLWTPLHDPATGGCRDGLHPDRVNENQGAESTLSLLLSQVELRGLGVVAPRRPATEPGGALRKGNGPPREGPLRTPAPGAPEIRARRRDSSRERDPR